MAYCPKCSEKIPKDAAFCPRCGSAIRRPRIGRSGYLTAAGVLTIIAACFCIISGIGGCVMFATGEYHYRYYTHPPQYLLAGIFGLLGFAFGLTAGILALKRTHYPLVVIGIALIAIGAILTLALNVAAFLAMGIPTIILAILGMILVGITRAEFA